MQRPIPGFPGYFATDCGEIIGRRGRPLSQYIDRDGYAHVSVEMADGTRVHRGVHRLVAIAFHGLPAPGLETRHLDHNRRNNAPANLCWGTRQQNSDDRTRAGHVPRGESHSMAKITLAVARRIKAEALAGVLLHRQIAARYGVSKSLVSLIRNGKNWKELTSCR